MIPLLVAIWLIFLTASACAAPPARPCPYMSFGWSVSYSTGSILSVSYAGDFQLLYVIFNIVTPNTCPLLDETGAPLLAEPNGGLQLTDENCPQSANQRQAATAFANVPLSVTQAFSGGRDPAPAYASVLAQYHSVLLDEVNNCPILVENQQLCPLLSETKVPLLSQLGLPLLNETQTCPLAKYPAYVFTK